MFGHPISAGPVFLLIYHPVHYSKMSIYSTGGTRNIILYNLKIEKEKQLIIIVCKRSNGAYRSITDHRREMNTRRCQNHRVRSAVLETQ